MRPVGGFRATQHSRNTAEASMHRSFNDTITTTSFPDLSAPETVPPRALVIYHHEYFRVTFPRLQIVITLGIMFFWIVCYCLEGEGGQIVEFPLPPG